MSEFTADNIWRLAKVGCGALLILLGMFLPSMIEPADVANMAKLETDGVLSQGTVRALEVSPVQAPRHSTAGTFFLLRGLGASRKVAIGSALIARSNARSAARAQANGPAYYDIEYEFSWGNGQTATGSDRLMLPRSHSLDVGGQIEVLHDARDPSVHRLPNYSKATQAASPPITYGPALLSALLGALVIWWGLQRTSADNGSAAPATAARIEPQAARVRPSSAGIPKGRVGFGPAQTAARSFGPKARV